MNISKHIIDKDASILDALRQLNATTNFTLFVVDENIHAATSVYTVYVALYTVCTNLSIGG